MMNHVPPACPRVCAHGTVCEACAGHYAVLKYIKDVALAPVEQKQTVEEMLAVLREMGFTVSVTANTTLGGE